MYAVVPPTDSEDLTRLFKKRIIARQSEKDKPTRQSQHDIRLELHASATNRDYGNGMCLGMFGLSRLCS